MFLTGLGRVTVGSVEVGMPVVAVSDLGRDYGSFTALTEVSFSVESGEIVGLLGPNGAGKSTTMKILTGYLAPTRGSVTVCGHDVLENPIGVRGNIGYLPESAPLYEEMRVGSYLQFIGKTRGLGAAERSRAMDRVLEECGLTERINQHIRTLSKGYRQRVGLAQALLHQPKLLILDEPTSGLDPNQKRDMRAIIRRVGETKTVLLSTHILPEVELTCDRVMIINQGRLAADGPTEQILVRGTEVRLLVGLMAGKVVASEDELASQLCGIEGVTDVQPAAPVEESVRFTVLADRDVRAAVFEWAVKRGHVLVELASDRGNLEDVFQRLTIGSEGVDAA